MFDMVTIGGSTKDIFITTNSAEIIDLKRFAERKSLLCLNYGEKIELDKLTYDIGGGAVNASVNFSNLGINTSTLIKVGDDCNGSDILARLSKKGVDTSLALKTNKYNTGSSFIITTFEGERTVMMERGANSQISKEEIPWNLLKNTKWIYLSSLSGNSNLVVDDIIEFAKQNNISVAFNPGRAQLKRGALNLKKSLKNTDILVLNKTEASLFTGIKESYEECINHHDNHSEGLSFDFTSPKISDIENIFLELKSFGPKIIVITEGSKGSQAFDGNNFYYAPIFPIKAISTLGAGDAFASTFVASIMKYENDIEKALTFASINSACVVQDFSAHLTVKNFNEIENILKLNPDYKVFKKEIAYMF